jgi:hypothetical protein
VEGEDLFDGRHGESPGGGGHGGGKDEGDGEGWAEEAVGNRMERDRMDGSDGVCEEHSGGATAAPAAAAVAAFVDDLSDIVIAGSGGCVRARVE